jgi:3-hydroxyanthranilate 3,4-dioxygenase
VNSLDAVPGDLQAFDLIGWIDRNPDKLRPPTGGMALLRLEDFRVTAVGGPNSRNDYHINPTEELFFQLEGTATTRSAIDAGIETRAFDLRLTMPEHLDESVSEHCLSSRFTSQLIVAVLRSLSG